MLLPVYPPEVEARLVQRLARATRSVIAAPQAGTTAFVQHASTYQRDGRVYAGGGAARPDASALVRDFLGHMQERRMDEARRLLAPGFTMQFPGTGPMHALEELVQWAKGRYQSVAKDYLGFDECWNDDGTVVYCHGHLKGVWLDGSAFGGIRFIDRFLVVDGLLAQQDVWNDMGEVRGARAAAGG